MKKKMMQGYALWIMVLTVFLGLNSCSDNDSDSAAEKYKLQVSNYSYNYSANEKVMERVNSIIAYYNRSQSGFNATSEEASQIWKEAGDSLYNYDWAGEDYLLSDSTSLTLSLVIVTGSSEGNSMVSQRIITLPHFEYRFQTANESANYSLNGRAQVEVSKILARFYGEGETTFFATRSDAKKRFDDACDSINVHRWKSNELSILKGTSFTLQLAGGTRTMSEPWPTYMEKEITLPNY